ncbi:MAG: DUF3305 domain-containing protein [Burkholderiales bacterium]|nr:DUF3305 domain-containing protein [Burkholderiales bacterium]
MIPRKYVPAGMRPRLDVEPVPVRVVFERHESGGRWQAVSWRPVAIEPGEAGDALALRLTLDEAEGYYLNLTTAEPSIFVLWRHPDDDSGVVAAGDPAPPHALAVSASYNEAGRWMDGGERVDRVPMPEAMKAWLAEYVTLHYVPERQRKKGGDRPSFMPRQEFAAMIERERAAGVPPEDEP